MATECSSSESDVDLDEQIDRFDDFYFGDDVEETGIVVVGASQPGVAPYHHELDNRSPSLGGESDAESAAAQCARPPPRLDNTKWFVVIQSSLAITRPVITLIGCNAVSRASRFFGR